MPRDGRPGEQGHGTHGRPDGGPQDGAPGASGPGGGALGGGALGDGPLLTVAEVADSLRVSRMTVYRLIERGELPAVRVGRSYRVPGAAAASFVEAARTTPRPARGAGGA